MADQNYYAHPSALVASHVIGSGTRIWAFSNIQDDVRIGEDCNICDHCFIESGVRIGDRVTIKNGVSLWTGMTIESDVFVGPYAVFTNDVYPRSQVRRDKFDQTFIAQGASIGANATVVANRRIGRYAFVGAGAVVTHDVDDHVLVVGNPARPVGFVCRCARRLQGKTDSAVQEMRCDCGLIYRFSEGRLQAD
ncbi:MAG: acyltransferase [Candidatus Zixiibacteriota bacterium]